MSMSEITSIRRSPVIQFSIFSENKVGILSEIIGLLARHNVHVMALSTIDTADSSILRMVVDDPDKAGELFYDTGHPFNQSDVLGVQMETEADLARVLSALLEAEINIHYLYPFIARPNGRCGLVLHLEDRELGVDALSLRGFTVLDQNDISR